jgi:hypothetical protein
MAYLQAVEVADNQALEQGVQQAVNQFVIGCKADGIWTAIKASCILAGARTLTGALVPLVGTAPTNVDGLFVSDDYNRKTGLGQNGNSSKWLNTNYASNADSRQNNNHQAFYNTAIDSSSLFVLGNINSTGGITMAAQGSFRNMNATFQIASGTPVANTMYATSRNSSSSYTALLAGLLETFTQSSETPNSGNLGLFRLSGTTATPSANLRVSFYSAGNALDLALLDARVTTLINAFGAAIP